ncbi:MAG TPA: dienelactone hydrolase family protein [Pseudoxanthomonas sp.]|nr:dienelactone hydrolase family protein [Pseudoxanthomonas sp.]
MGQWTELDTVHGRIGAWRESPDHEPRAAIVVVQEIFGVNPHIRSVAARYAQAGYLAVAPAYFDVIEPGVELDYDAAGIARGRELVAALGLEKANDLTASTAQALGPSDRIGTVGYCWGGTVALLAALRLGLPSVSYYGARNLPFLEEPAKALVMFHFGERDASIPPEMVARHRRLMPQMRTYTYPAGHGFNCDVRADYCPASADLAWQRSLAFLDEHLR